MALSGLLLTDLSATTSIAHLFAAYVLFGLGFGAVNPPITDTAVSGMPADQAGVAAAVASTSRQVGMSLGVAVVGAVAVPAGALAGAGGGEIAAIGWWIVTGCGALVLALGLLTTSAWARATATRTARALTGGAA